MTGIAPSQVTIVVPTMNEEANIGRFLASVPDTIAVIVVDSGTDGTAAAIEALRPRSTRVVRVRANIPQARQIGSQLATTPWLLFTDADVIFGPSYFDCLGSVPVGIETAGVVGSKGTVEGFGVYHRWFTRGQTALMAVGVPAATGSNMLLRRDVLDAIGGFDPALSVNEDAEVMFRVRRCGHHVAFRPDLSVLSFDHRRLEAGLARKVAHGALRNTALYLGIGTDRVRRGDWGYWAERPEPAPGAAGSVSG